MSSSFPSQADGPGGARLRVLVVDDSAEDRELYRRLLAKAAPQSFEIVESETGEDGLRRLAAERVDCVLLDYQLPDGNGLDLLPEVRRAAPAPAVILLTGRGDEGTAVEAMKRGAQDYLVKGGITADGLSRAIQHAVDKLALQRGLDEAHQRLDELVRQRTRELELAITELRDANRLKDEFLATLSHELRTPLNAILGWAAVLRAGRPDPATVERAAEVIERNARAQAQLIADLLDMSAIVTGKLRLEVAPLAVRDLLHAVEETVRPSAVAKGIALKVAVDPGLPPLLADASRLQQVVWNLLTNAVKFTGRGGEVTVTALRRGDHVEIAVADNGIGIREEFLPFVFDRFRQQDSSTTRVHSGLGLGLAIVRHLVEAHGGTVEASSAGDGAGATFRVALPVPESSPAPGAEDAAAPARDPSALAALRVLVVEDDADSRDLYRVILESRGASVAAVATTAAAWRALVTAPTDVLVCDIGLPGEDGYSLVRRLRSDTAAGVRAIPAVALTAYAAPEDADRARAAGFQVHLPKPVSPEALVDVVHRLAGRAGRGPGTSS